MSKDKPDAWMPLYIGDWDGDTADLSCEEDGAYGRLVRSYWRKGPPVDDDVLLARIVRMDLRSWRRIRPTIAAFFQICKGVWRHKRVDLELERWTAKKAAASLKAQVAAEKRWAKTNAPSNARSIRQAMLEHCPSSSSTEEEAHNRASSLCGGEPSADRPDGSASSRLQSEPEDPIRQRLRLVLGVEFVARFFDGCTITEGILHPSDDIARARLERDAAQMLAQYGVTIAKQAASA